MAVPATGDRRPRVWRETCDDDPIASECTPVRILTVVVFACVVVVPLVLIFGVIGKDKVSQAFLDAAPAEPSIANAIAFFCINFAIIVCAMPIWVLGSMAVGFTFGFWTGFCINYVTYVAASCACFGIGRYAFKDAIRKFLMRQRVSRVATRVIEQNDFKFLVLFRFMPLPLAVKNYLPACIKVHPFSFFLTVLITGILYTPVFTFIGSTTKEMHNLYAEQKTAAGENAIFTVNGFQVVIVAVSLLATIAITILSYFEWQKISTVADDLTIPSPPTTSRTEAHTAPNTGRSDIFTRSARSAG